MLSTLWEHIENPVIYALPFFALFIALEVASLRFLAHDAHDAHDHGAPPRGYEAKDTRASLGMGGGALVVMALYKAATLVLYTALFVYLAPWHLPTGTWWYWAALFFVIDFAWYCYHRFSHRVRIGWAAHQAHHSSEYFNLGTALRQKWNPWLEGLFWVPLPLLGFSPWTIYVMFGFNLIFQFFVHTETVGKLPRPVEYVFNTPSHHRVHHASDAEYLDRNYGGVLIIWDRMFGTFTEERHRPTYGLTKPVGTYNVLTLQYHEYGSILRDVRSARRLRDKLGYVLAPPGWQPADRRAPATAVTPADPGRLTAHQGTARVLPQAAARPTVSSRTAGTGSRGTRRS